MMLVLTGGGSAGHITPLLAVAHELKRLQPDIRLVYIGERGGKFGHLPAEDPAIEQCYFISAGKFRRYAGQTRVHKALDVPTNARNVRDVGRLMRGNLQAYRLLKKLKPDGVFIKGGFVGVPVGWAAARLGIPYVTHDSDTVPGLANRLIAKNARVHATGMPAQFYSYPAAKTAFVGVPIIPEFQPITPALRDQYRRELGLEHYDYVVTMTGGSQGSRLLNEALVRAAPALLQAVPRLAIVHIVGPANEGAMNEAYKQSLTPEQHAHVVVKGFVGDMYRHSGAADVIITRAGATNTAEFGAQRQACIMIPALLAGDHQTKNAQTLAAENAVLYLIEKEVVQDPGVLTKAVVDLLHDTARRRELGRNLARFARMHASEELARLLLDTFTRAGTATGQGKERLGA
jgi:UDP-N-acetylglucosamine--N-acetylmuramyl-(pentapeptide) pyrophosphoryl-undecaprenol N-acetylglucosamine transferase